MLSVLVCYSVSRNEGYLLGCPWIGETRGS
jgi:hypothetical protein